MYFLAERINEAELYESAEKLNLAGGDGSKMIEQYQMSKELVTMSSNTNDDDYLLKLTMDLEKESTNVY